MQSVPPRFRRALNRRFFEVLETRKLLTTYSVADFGAVPNDGVDDSAAVQRAINASAPGDTISFGPGNYTLGSSVEALGAGRSLVGNGAVLQSGANNFALHFNGSGLNVSGFTFVGRGIFMDNPSNQMVSNVNIANNSFATTGTAANGIEFTSGLHNSVITNNTFTQAGGADNGIYGYYWDNLNISHNTFSNVNEGIHVTDQDTASKDLTIAANKFTGVRRMGVEYQGGGSNTVVEDNYYSNPVMDSNPDNNGDVFAYSIIADASTGTIVRRNAAVAPDRPDGIGVRIMYEIGGDNTLVEDNYSLGGNNVLAENDMNGTTSALVQNNLWVDYLEGAIGNGLTLINNGPNVTLDWDINRDLAGAQGAVNLSTLTALLPEPSSALIVFALAGLTLRRTARRIEKKSQAGTI